MPDIELYFSVFCRDMEAQLSFYTALLRTPEAEDHRSPIYRCIKANSFELGFHAAPAYALLGVADRLPARQTLRPVTSYATFMLSSCEEVDAMASRVDELGGRIIKGPYPTYYGQWQTVLVDPENNMFRLSVRGLPSGVAIPSLVL